MISIHDFLPKYPDIETLGNAILNPYDKSFEEIIYRKKEFYDKKLEKDEPKPLKPGDLLRHQQIVARYLSAKTMYNSLLLFHEMGTGKTGVSIALVELIKSQGGFGKALVLMRSKALINNYIEELAFVNTPGTYIPENYENLKSEELKKRRVRKKVLEYYDFETFEVFAAKNVSKMTDGQIISEYSNRVIIIDEVHNIRPGSEGGIDIYQNIHRFLHLVKNCKILLMSATPMKDKPQEIANILNLILPLTNQMPTGKDFITEYMIPGKREDLYLFNSSKIDQFRKYLKGRISYLKTQKTTIKKELGGKTIGKLQKFKVYGHNMSVFQRDGYISSYKIDTGEKEKGIYSNSRQSSLFVFPDESWGSDGFKKYVIERKFQDSTIFDLNPEFKKDLKSEGDTPETIISNISKFSAKYAKVISMLRESHKQGRLSFVYGDFVKGSGMILFSKLLELVGFKKTNGGDTTPGLRYSIITNTTTSEPQIRNIIKSYNNKKNSKGEYISVLIGSKVISEGFSLKNVQDIHIMTPHWNYSETDQAIARGIRAFSHQDLLNQGVNPVVSIYQHVSIYENIGDCIDYKMYLISEDKDISIKAIERIIKESAFDCALTYMRNVVYGLDNMRECDYTSCDYKCIGNQQEIELKKDELDDITYNLYYSESDVNSGIEILKNLYKTKNKYSFEELCKYISEKYILLKVLDYVIQEKIPLFNRKKQICYLKQYGDTFYLDISVDTESTLTQPSYLENIVFFKKSRLIDAVAQSELKNLPNTIGILESTETYGDIFPNLTVYTQELFIEGSILAKLKNIDKNKNLREWILEYYDKYIIDLENGDYVSLFMYENSDNKIIRCLPEGKNRWIDCTEKYKSEVENLKNKKVVNTAGGYYGEIKNKKFLIVDVSDETKLKGGKGINREIDKRTKTKGRVCKTITKVNLIKLCVKLGITPKKEFLEPLEGLSIEKLRKLKDDPIYEAIKKVYTREELKNLTKDELIIALGFSNLKMSNNKICEIIEEWFKNNNKLL